MVPELAAYVAVLAAVDYMTVLNVLACIFGGLQFSSYHAHSTSII